MVFRLPDEGNSQLLVSITVQCHNKVKIFFGGPDMEIQDILKNLREKHNLTQEQMAERVMVTRQAVSRWENGETQPI